MALTRLKRAFAFADVDPGQSGAEVAKAAGYSGTRASLRRIASRNRKDPDVAALTDRLRRMARGEDVGDIEAEEAEDLGHRGFVWVGNGRGPGPERSHDPADPTPFVEGGPWRPQPGPQTAFAECEADLAIYGGSAGGGKSFAALYELAKWQHVAGFRGIIFRRLSTEITGGDGLWDESQEMFGELGGRPREGQHLDWRWPSGARVQFRHMQREKDRFSHRGQQYAVVIFDELTTFTAKQFWYLLSRLRSTSGIRPYMRATCNPDCDSFVYDLVEWYLDEDGYPIPERSGVVRWFVRVDEELRWFDSEAEALEAHPGARPLSFTFIAAKLSDNAVLVEQDPDYRAKLEAMDRVERLRLLGDGNRGGNWHARDSAGLVFARADFQLAPEAPAEIATTVRFWDRAASEPTPKHPEPDWTRGVRMSLCKGAKLWIDDVVSMRKRGTEVLEEMRSVAEADGIRTTVGLWQDTGGAGKTEIDTTMVALSGFVVEVVESFSADKSLVDVSPRSQHRSSPAKRAFARAWAPWVRQRRVFVLIGQVWTPVLVNECDGFPDAKHDDIVDAISGGFQVLVGSDSGFSWWETIRQGAEKARQA